jgi:hypothetical protein
MATAATAAAATARTLNLFFKDSSWQRRQDLCRR